MVTDWGFDPNKQESEPKAMKLKFTKSTFACPVCGTHYSRVWTKLSGDDNTAIRIRLCSKGHKFRTVEKVVTEKVD